jgi:RimJ/RimL family protein N-acetyltransferase
MFEFRTMDVESPSEVKLILDFYRNNPSEYIVFDPDDELYTEDYTYYGMFDMDTNEMVAATSIEEMTENLVTMWTTVVKSDRRGEGIGTLLNVEMIEHLKELGYGKISSHIYVENLPSIVLKLKLGYIIEGTLRDHDKMGQHEYVLNKTL